MLSSSDTLQDLQKWSTKQCDGYAGVKIKDMHSSWRDGLAFCALIHRYRPDLIDFHSLKPGDVRVNNELAFRIAREHLGIFDLLDVNDLERTKSPDPLSIATYVSTMRSQFYNKNPEGGPGVRKRVGNDSTVGAAGGGSNSPTEADRENAANVNIDLSRRSVHVSSELTCEVCKQRVFILDRYILDGSGKVCHKSCAMSGQIDNLLSVKRERESTVRRRQLQDPSNSDPPEVRACSSAEAVNGQISEEPVANSTSNNSFNCDTQQSAACSSSKCFGTSPDREADAAVCINSQPLPLTAEVSQCEVVEKCGEEQAASQDNCDSASLDATLKTDSQKPPDSCQTTSSDQVSKNTQAVNAAESAQATTSSSNVTKRNRNPFAPDRPPPPRVTSAVSVTRMSLPSGDAVVASCNDSPSTVAKNQVKGGKQKREYPKALNPFDLEESEHDTSASEDTVCNGSESFQNGTRMRPHLVFKPANSESNFADCKIRQSVPSVHSFNSACTDSTTKAKPARPSLPPKFNPQSSANAARKTVLSVYSTENQCAEGPSLLSRRVVRTTNEFGGSQTYDELLTALTELRTRQLELEKRARELERTLRHEEVQTVVAKCKTDELSALEQTSAQDAVSEKGSGKTGKLKKNKKNKHKRVSSGERALKSGSLNERLLSEWFALVAERSTLFARESELMAFARLRQLDDLHSDIEFDLRRLHHKREEGAMDDQDLAREKELIPQLSRVVQDRAELSEQIVDLLNRHTESQATSHR